MTADFVEYVRLASGLEHIAYLATAFSTADVPPAIADAWRLYLVLTQSAKPVVSGAFTEHGVPRMAEMMSLFRRDRADLAARPLSIFTITATGSFRYGEDSCQNLLDCVEWGIPIEIVPVTLMGLIAPVTLSARPFPHGGRAGRHRHGADRPSWRSVVRRRAGRVSHARTTAPMSAVEAMRRTWPTVRSASILGSDADLSRHEREPGGGCPGRR